MWLSIGNRRMGALSRMAVVVPTDICEERHQAADCNLVVAAAYHPSSSRPDFREIFGGYTSLRDMLRKYLEPQLRSPFVPRLSISFTSPTLRFIPLLASSEEHVIDAERASRLLSIPSHWFDSEEAEAAVFSPLVGTYGGGGLAAAVIMAPQSDPFKPPSRVPKAEILIRLYYSGLIISEQVRQVELVSLNSSGSTVTHSVPFFQRIFASYAREDARVVECVGSILRALQLGDLRRDLEILRAGDDWEKKLYREIEGADSFQLFWSHYAKLSRNVQSEWRYALSLDRERFVRPVYWEEPLIEPPRALRRLHFAKIQLPISPPSR